MGVRLSRATAAVLVLLLIGLPRTECGAQSRPPRPGLSGEEMNVLRAVALLSFAKKAKCDRRYREARDNLELITALPFPRDPQAQELLAGTFLLLAEVNLAQNALDDSHRAAWSAIRKNGKRRNIVTAEAYKVLSRIAETRGRYSEAQHFMRVALQILDSLGN